MDHDHRDATELLRIAQFGLAHSFFGNLYESVVDVPTRLAGEPQPSLYSPGSPTRYFLPTAPITRAALLVAVATGWRRPERRPGLAAALVAAVGDAAVTVYLVRRVNARLFVAGPPLTSADRETLQRRWHRLNLVRLVVEPAAWLAVADARQVGRS